MKPAAPSTAQASNAPMTNADAMAALADLFASPATKRAAPVKKPAAPAVVLPLAKAFAQRKTGYTTWKALSRVVLIQRQECTCCGAVHKVVKDEMFVLQNSASHSIWRRHEAYGIEAPEALPIEVEMLAEIQFTSACGECAEWDFDSISTSGIRQLEFTL